MCYGHWMQCSFMSGPPLFGRRQKPRQEGKQIANSLEKYQIPQKCTLPESKQDGPITVYGFQQAEVDAGHPTGADQRVNYSRMTLEMSEKAIIFGSGGSESLLKESTHQNGSAAKVENESDSIEEQLRMRLSSQTAVAVSSTEPYQKRERERQRNSTSSQYVHNKAGEVFPEHAALLHNRGKLYLKPINGVTTLFSISEFSTLLKDSNERTPRIYTNTGGVKSYQLAGGIDKLQQLTKEFCCFTLGGDDSTVYWVQFGRMPLGDTEYEKGGKPPEGGGMPRHPRDQPKEGREREARERAYERPPRHRSRDRRDH